MKRILITILICLMLPISVLAVTYGKTGESTNFNGDVGVPSGSGYYVNGVQVTSAILSDVASIAMLDEEETITQDWTFTNYIELWKTSDAAAATPCFQLRRRRDGDPTDDVSSGDGCGEITFEAYHTDAFEEAARIMGFVDGTPGDDDMPGRLEFQTTPDGAWVPLLRMAIDSAGNIKMGDGVWTNYIQITAAGALTTEGAATIEGYTATAWDDIGNPDAADEIDFGAHIVELNVENFQVGDGGDNYVDFNGGALTLAGTATICTVDAAEFGYLEGVTEEIQTALDTIGVATSITDGLIIEADLNGDEDPADNDILTFDTTGANFSWQTKAELTIASSGANTDITSLVNAALTIGRDADNEIDFSSDNIIQFRTSAADCVSIGTAGEVDLQQFYILLDDALGTDHDYSGLVDSDTVGESVVFGDLLYFDWTDVEWKKAKADAIGTTPCQRIALESKANGEACLMLVQGWIRDDSAFDFGASRIFLNDDTAGTCDDTAPAESGDQIQVVGIGTSADTMYFNPSVDVGEI